MLSYFSNSPEDNTSISFVLLLTLLWITGKTLICRQCVGCVRKRGSESSGWRFRAKIQEIFSKIINDESVVRCILTTIFFPFPWDSFTTFFTSLQFFKCGIFCEMISFEARYGELNTDSFLFDVLTFAALLLQLRLISSWYAIYL